MTVKGIPASITIGPFVVVVSTDEADMVRWKAKDQTELSGRWDEATQTITIDASFAAGYVRDVLLHECLHAIIGITALGHDLDEKAEERLVRTLSPMLLDLLRRNPALVKFLTTT